MFGKIRPFIFKFDPETAHNLAIQALKFNLMPRNQKQNFKHIETEIFNKKIPNPIGLAAGFDKDAEVYNSIFRITYTQQSKLEKCSLLIYWIQQKVTTDTKRILTR